MDLKIVLAGKSFVLLANRSAPAGKIKVSPGFGGAPLLQFWPVVQLALGTLLPVQTRVVGRIKNVPLTVLFEFINKANGLLVELTLPVKPVKALPGMGVAVSVTTEPGAYFPPWSGKGLKSTAPAAIGLVAIVRL